MEENKKGKVIIVMIVILILIILIFLFIKACNSSEKVQREKIEEVKEKQKSAKKSLPEKDARQDKPHSASQQESKSSSSKTREYDIKNDLKKKKNNAAGGPSDKENLIWEKAVYQTKKMLKKRKLAIFPNLNTIGTSVKIVSKGTYLVSGFFIFNQTEKYYFQCLVFEDKHKVMSPDIPKIQDHEF